MRLLLGTNIVMYLINDTNEMTADVEMMVTDFGNTLFICSATIRELVANWNKYEYMQKRWKSPADMLKYMEEAFYIEVLYPHREHYSTFANLLWNKEEDHRDTTDLLIIAHAITEKMTLISSDRKFPFYRKQGLQLIYNKKITNKTKFH